ncbi:MAG: O-antigen polysaccharide polymerase Wzy [Acidobacteria bacterium]|jgi:hypothetical protein|nr:O-antigen polysaccharide polymerase Wzy [Acidobacteriota bacterium]HOF82153.1 O-antigen polysaccharide polymerase Wzy [Candidatus Aminicenantes bacterium]NMD10889.1 O-antigen polysaccharide polymerase Wzy [Acidobacteriota bacterium]HOS10317.1 O-antigen polysaccharide polymerase Wzy [Candidatus Aminicenantes bacterium]HOU49028.1 O-antigen polysaccharide polymerase Wzy [Candidatus Aminicenantes bacterium]
MTARPSAQRLTLAVAFFFLVLSFALYAFAPDDYSLGYCAAVLAVFLASTAWFIKKSLFGNYFNFHVLFIIGFFLVHFVYPVFVYPNRPFLFKVFERGFDPSLITVSTALALLGMNAYILGAVFGGKIKNVPPGGWDAERYRPLETPLFVLSLALFALFVFFSRDNIARGVFNAYSAASEYLLIAFQGIFPLALMVSFVGRLPHDDGRGRSLFRVFRPRLVGLSVLAVFVFLYVGDRGPAIQIVLIYGALFTTFLRPLRLMVFAILIAAGMYLMMFVSQARTVYDDTREDESTIIAYYKRGAERFVPESVFDFGRDMIVNNRNLYLAVSYVQNNERTLGRTFLTQILSVVPGLQSVYVTLFHVDLQDISSGQLLTYHEYEGGARGAGLGNTIIADVYISFGAAGVLVMMMLFGYANMKFQRGAIDKVHLYYLIAYVVSLSFSIYYPRSGYFTALRGILWPAAIVWLFEKFVRKPAAEGSPFAGSGA